MRFVLVLVLVLSFWSMQLLADQIRVAAATNLRYVLPVLAEKFELQTSHQIVISYAASGTLTTQIQHDAPFDVFLSANPSYIKRLVAAGKADSEIVGYAQAQLAFYKADHSNLKLDKDLKGLVEAVDDGSLNKVVIANPKHAPYGQAAEKALKKAGLWQKIQAHLLIAENASQALQFAMSTSVDAGFVPYSNVIQPKLKTRGSYVKLDNLLPQQAVLIKKATMPANQFLGFIQTQAARTILSNHGFVVKGKE
jgi:molybdate transport system substrate-binding protein